MIGTLGELRIAFFLTCAAAQAQSLTVPWTTQGHDAQHTSVSRIAGQPLEAIRWQTPVDRILAGTTGTLLVHYGSPVITARNTVLVPVRTVDGWVVEARQGSTGELKYTLETDYTPPAHEWVPMYGPALSARNRVYWPCAGGTVCYRDSPDEEGGGVRGRIAFYGDARYGANPAAFEAAVRISGPIVADRSGNIFFAFRVSGGNPAGLTSGVARISASGAGSWVSAAAAAADPEMAQVPLNGAPALGNDHRTLYFAVNARENRGGYLVAVNAQTLAPAARVRLRDPRDAASDALLLENSTASPVVGPDGDVYFGVFEVRCCANNARGWLLHFDAALAAEKLPAAFGWDTNPSIVRRGLVPGYEGDSPYLILTKYNNYRGAGTGDGLNRLALLDPGTPMRDPITGVTVMREVHTILGPTDDPRRGGVKEWCVNSAVIDSANKSALVNNEDGVLYRWDFTTNSLSQRIRLTPGIAEAYTPTLIGPEGTVYAINDAILFAVGAGTPAAAGIPTPSPGAVSTPPGGRPDAACHSAAVRCAIFSGTIPPDPEAVRSLSALVLEFDEPVAGLTHEPNFFYANVPGMLLPSDAPYTGPLFEIGVGAAVLPGVYRGVAKVMDGETVVASQAFTLEVSSSEAQ